MADDLEEARRRRQQRRATQPAGAFGGPSGRKKQAINEVLAKVDAAAEAHDPAAYWAGKTPTPERITLALNFCELYGPEVDEALGGEEPMVDEWESGVRVPSLAQIQALAKLTCYTVRFFYQPPPPPITGGWMCGSDGCTPQLEGVDEAVEVPAAGGGGGRSACGGHMPREAEFTVVVVAWGEPVGDLPVSGDVAGAAAVVAEGALVGDAVPAAPAR